jgi:hypothetical protein
MTRAVVWGVVLALTWGARPAEACAGCSNPNLPGARSTGDVTLAPGAVSASFNLSGTTMHVVHLEACPDIGPICAQRDEPDQLHDQQFYVAELRPVIEVGLSKTLGVELQLPFRVVRTTILFRRLDGERFTPDYENIHHRNQTLAGFSDPWLSGRAAWALGLWRFTARVGLTFPVGQTRPDPFALGRAGEVHEHLQFGTGTLNPIAALDIGLPVGRFFWSAYGQTQLVFAANGHGYRAGNRYAAGLSGQVRLGEKVHVGLSTDLVNEQAERWGGVVQEDGNVGRTDALLGARVGTQVGAAALGLSLKFPVWQHFLGEADHGGAPGQLTYPVLLNLSVGFVLGA